MTLSMDNFWERFPLKENAPDEVKVIIGQEPYKQGLGGTKFAVDGGLSSLEFYKSHGCIAFLVSDWIKVQDTLEMVFNLMFGHDFALSALSFLRENKISAPDFADSLWLEAGVMLFNRTVEGVDKSEEIAEVISESIGNKRVSVLFTGEHSSKKFPMLPMNAITARAIHPSGTNLNNPICAERYADNWYLCNGDLLKDASSEFSLDSFRIISGRKF